MNIFPGPENQNRFLNRLFNLTNNLHTLKKQIFTDSFQPEELNIDIENLMNAVSLVNALKQAYARRNKIPLSDVRISA